MPTLLSEFDLSAPDILEQLDAAAKRAGEERQAAYLALMAALTESQRELLYALIAPAQIRDSLVGARLAVKGFAKIERMAVHEATCRAESAEAKLARLEKPVKKEYKPSPRDYPAPNAARPLDGLERAFTPDDAPPPTWDYAPAERRRPKRGEVITSDPFGVEVVARQVEAFVLRHGECVKPDVSAALSPDVRGLLSQAYAHLHASRRVHVDGWRLSTWPHGERA